MLELFKIYDCGLPLKRYGNDYDGGYIIADGLDYDCFISGGAGSNITFESDFLKENKIPAYVFDSSVYMTSNDFLFHHENIDSEHNLHEYLSKYHNMFLKLDIEGSEFLWFDILPIELQKNIKQIVIEFHGAEQSIPYIKQLQQTHTLIHLHGNNYSPMVTIEGRGFPNVYEVTFLRNDFEFKLSETKLPCELDMPNNPSNNEINLNFL